MNKIEQRTTQGPTAREMWYMRMLVQNGREPSFDEKLIPVGKDAPDFQLPQPGGNRIALSDVRKEKKAVLVNFWFYG